MTASNIRFLGVLLLWASVSACASARRTSPNRTATGITPTSAASASDLAAMAKASADSARLPYTETDVRFMSGMIGHHSQAIEMSQLVPKRSTNASVLILSERIINAQEDEITIMRRWLRDRRQPVPAERATSVATMPDGHQMSGMSHNGMMPGMLSAAQMQQLGNATGPAFDELFLTFMIQHHRGAVSMVLELFATTGAGQDETVFKFASDVNVDQSTEIARMERMLFMLRLERKSP